MNLVIGPGEHQNSLDGVLIRQAGLLHFGFEIDVHFFQFKRLPKLVHNPTCESAGQSQLKKFPLEERLLVAGVRDLTRLGEEAGWGEDLDPMVDVDDTRSKSDGGNGSLRGGAQAENKKQSAGRQV